LAVPLPVPLLDVVIQVTPLEAAQVQPANVVTVTPPVPPAEVKVPLAGAIA